MCYVIGGTENSPGKWVRRYLGGITFGASICLLSWMAGSFKWPLLALIVLYPLCLSGNYGASKIEEKLLLRFIYGLSFGLTGLYAAFFFKQIPLGIVELLLSVGSSMFWGVFNPVRSVDEQARLGLAFSIAVPFMF
jgi:hypothetical protein